MRKAVNCMQKIIINEIGLLLHHRQKSTQNALKT